MNFKEFCKKIFGDNESQNNIEKLPDDFQRSLKYINSIETTAQQRSSSAVDYDDKKKKNPFIVSDKSKPEKTIGKSPAKKMRSEKTTQELEQSL